MILAKWMRRKLEKGEGEGGGGILLTRKQLNSFIRSALVLIYPQ